MRAKGVYLTVAPPFRCFRIKKACIRLLCRREKQEKGQLIKKV